ncbi:MAG: hypothetical protein AB7O26_14145 [Planctomycetaceae bacterium]
MTVRRFLSGSLMLVCCFSLSAQSLQAGAKSEAAREAAEFMVRKFASETAKEGAETLAVRLETLAARHGDDVFAVAKNAGPRAIHAIEQAGDDAATAMKLLSRYGDDALSIASQPKSLAMVSRFGDDAAEALVRHPGVAESTIEAFGKPAATALKGLNGQNARRLAMMAEEQSLLRMSRGGELLGVIGKYGDNAMEFVWRNKGKLAVSAALVAFLNDPEPFITGTRDLASVLGESIGQPIAEQAARHFPWRTFYLLVFVLAVSATIWMMRVRLGVAWYRRLTGAVERTRP